jgi:hypothetical protein
MIPLSRRKIALLTRAVKRLVRHGEICVLNERKKLYETRQNRISNPSKYTSSNKQAIDSQMDLVKTKILGEMKSLKDWLSKV